MSREDSTFVTLIQCSSSVTSNSRNDCSKCFPSTSSATWTSGVLVSRSSRCDAISEPGTSEFDSEKTSKKSHAGLALRESSNRFELLAFSSLMSLEINGITWSKQVFTSWDLSNQLWNHATCRFFQHPTTETDSCRIFRASDLMQNRTIEDFAVSKQNQTSKVSYTDNPRPKKLYIIYKSWQNLSLIHPLFPLLLPVRVSLRKASFPPLASWSLSVCTTFRTFRSTLGGGKWQGVVSLSPQLGSVPNEELTWKAWRWWNLEGGEKKTRDISCLKVRKERPTTQVDGNDSLFVSRRDWGSDYDMDEIGRLSKHFVKQQASPMPSPRAKVWWAGAAAIDVLHNDSPQVTELAVSSCSDPPQATLKWFQKKNTFIVWCIP